MKNFKKNFIVGVLLKLSVERIILKGFTERIILKGFLKIYKLK